MRNLASFIGGEWVSGNNNPSTLYNPTTDQPIAHTSTQDIDGIKALSYARQHGGPALRALTFVQRGHILKQCAAAIHNIREQLIALAIENGGNTRKDAKFDIDGASYTLAHYATLSETLGNVKLLADEKPMQLGRTARFSGQHILSPHHGVAVHINAFNFPAWGFAEKAACALLAGMPIVTKPATATALVAYRIAQEFVEKQIFPKGALSFWCGSAGSLLDGLGANDVVAFTGSSDTAKRLQQSPTIANTGIPFNIEADSINIAILADGVEEDSETERLFIRDVVTDMTQKAGQKCTAIRRVLIPHSVKDRLLETIEQELQTKRVGDPQDKGTTVGPVATKTQQTDVQERLGELQKSCRTVYTNKEFPQTGYFVPPTLLAVKEGDTTNSAVHDVEVFGPVATVIPYDGNAKTAADIAALGGGGLVASYYGSERTDFADFVSNAASQFGRIYLGSEKMASMSPGPGTAMPEMLHGGPGRAGGGTELGGLRGLRLYQQCTALQGDTAILRAMLEE